MAAVVSGNVAAYESSCMPIVRLTIPATKPFQKVIWAGVMEVIRAVK